MIYRSNVCANKKTRDPRPDAGVSRFLNPLPGRDTICVRPPPVEVPNFYPISGDFPLALKPSPRSATWPVPCSYLEGYEKETLFPGLCPGAPFIHRPVSQVRGETEKRTSEPEIGIATF